MQILFLIPLLFFGYNCNTAADVLQDNISGKVVKIIDGDTFDVLTADLKTIRIRMFGIDAPERTQDYYQVSKDALGSYIFGKQVNITVTGTDKFQRTIGQVFVDNENINLKMIQNGFAWHFKKYSSDAAFAEAEAVARNKKSGLWSMADPVAPWDYRRSQRN